MAQCTKFLICSADSKLVVFYHNTHIQTWYISSQTMVSKQNYNPVYLNLNSPTRAYRNKTSKSALDSKWFGIKVCLKNGENGSFHKTVENIAMKCQWSFINWTKINLCRYAIQCNTCTEPTWELLENYEVAWY